jgi:hypothetical protein
MEVLVLITLIVVAWMIVRQPEPRQQVIYVPLAVEERSRGGCLPLIVVGVVIVLLMLGMQG